MNCQRCNGLMVEDHCYDFFEGGKPYNVQTMRCICCGNIVDPLIMQHRSVPVLVGSKEVASEYVEEVFEPSAA